MPYVINWPPAKRAARLAVLAFLGVAVVSATGASPALADATSCTTPTLTQPFLSAGDTNLYTLAPGESADSFDGSGWTLLGQAKIVSTRLADGATGNVLDMPGGSVAISPPMCVDLTYQTARTMIRDTTGRGRVVFSVAYQDPSTGNWGFPQLGGWIGTSNADWTLSNTVNLQPSNASGTQMVRFVFGSFVLGSDPQLYDFYVDPYAKG